MRLFLCLLFLPLSLLAEDAPEPNYVFRAQLVRIIDGNQVAMNIDLGFGVWVHNQSLTLLNAGGAGLEESEKEKSNERIAKIRALLTKDSPDVIVRTVRDRDANPPRYFAEIWVEGVNLNEEMRKAFP
jgi:micrococcal nuclease